ncbi:MAG: hypothetical protein GF331_02715 [Chitinivibrionales bacterium]|nr:hypothetical protein [Chitinivibrionales bacterium]
MHNYQGDERRSTARTPLATFCPTSFSYNGRTYEALMIDLSEIGAHFRLAEHEEHVDLPAGTELIFDIRTPYGETSCRGVVRWSRHLGDFYRWGVRFTSVSDNPDDPIRALMNSSF